MNYGCYGFRLKGRDKVTMYTGDHREVGNKILNLVRDNEIDTIINAVEQIKVINAAYTPDDDQIEECVALGGDLADNWAEVLEFANGDPDKYLHGLKYMINNRDLLFDMYYCQVAYIINLDDQVVEIYKGPQDTSSRGRYANSPKAIGWRGVTLLREVPFDRIKRARR
jgi:hypothetical protein